MWTSECPREAGHYWFYGDPYKGQMGIDYRDDCPPIEPKMYLVEVIAISNGIMAVSEGNMIPLRKFNKENRGDGVIGYWKPAELPTPPNDGEELFG